MMVPSPKSIDIVEFCPCDKANIKEVTEPNDVPTNCEGDQKDRPSITRDATIAKVQHLMISKNLKHFKKYKKYSRSTALTVNK